MVDLAFLEVMLSDDSQKLGLLPRGKVLALGRLLGELERLVLRHLLLAVGHLELKPLVDLLELL